MSTTTIKLYNIFRKDLELDDNRATACAETIQLAIHEVFDLKKVESEKQFNEYKSQLKEDFLEFKSEIRAELLKFEAKFDAKIDKLILEMSKNNVEMLKWTIGISMSMVLLIAAVFKLFL